MKYMQKNIGNTDKIVRITIGIIFIIIALLLPLPLWKWIFGVIGGILVLTSIIRFCPLYTLFKFDTLENKNEKGEN